MNEVHERILVGDHNSTGRQLHREEISLLVLCAWQLPEPLLKQRRVKVAHVPLTDDAFEIADGDIERAEQGARFVAEEHLAGGTTLITCKEGLNRSAWVAAIAIRMLTGRGGDDVIEQIQSKRPNSLYSWFFQEHIKSMRASHLLSCLVRYRST